MHLFSIDSAVELRTLNTQQPVCVCFSYRHWNNMYERTRTRDRTDVCTLDVIKLLHRCCTFLCFNHIYLYIYTAISFFIHSFVHLSLSLPPSLCTMCLFLSSLSHTHTHVQTHTRTYKHTHARTNKQTHTPCQLDEWSPILIFCSCKHFQRSVYWRIVGDLPFCEF